MALEGTLRDFSLVDIFQLIGLQKKTGVLRLRNDSEEARILFENGLVVGADTNHQKLENRLGRVLVKTNRISQAELDQALAVQSKTLQRLGQVLIQKGFIKREDLKESLQIQVCQVIYRLFRWVDGEYHFNPENHIEYDRENITPLGSESILMEGVRMLDEWPLIEKVIPTFHVVVERSDEGRDIRLNIDRRLSLDSTGSDSFNSLLQDVISEESQEFSEKPHFDLSYGEERVLKLINEPTVVQDLIDRSGMNEFETCRHLYDLMEKKLVRRVFEQPFEDDMKVLEEEHHLPAWIPLTLLLGIGLLSFFISWNPLNALTPQPNQLGSMPLFFQDANEHGMNKVEDAIDLYFVKYGRLPRSITILVSENLLTETEASDPMGRPFGYDVVLNENRYKLYSRSAGGRFGQSQKAREKVFPLATDTNL